MRKDPEARQRDRHVEPIFSALDEAPLSQPRAHWKQKLVWALLVLTVLVVLIAKYAL